MRAASNPDVGLVLTGLQLTPGVYLKKLRMQRPLKKAERQFFYTYINLWPFHGRNPKRQNTNTQLCAYYKKIPPKIQAKYQY
jgi:hypothetical protein